VTRDLLAALVCTLALGAGLGTALLQSKNNTEAFELDEIRSECRMMEAVNGAQTVDVLELDWAPGAGRELLGEDARNAERGLLEGLR